MTAPPQTRNGKMHSKSVVFTETARVAVAIYARVSTNTQETLNQLAQLREFCHRQGWQVPIEYIDRESGVAVRDEFQKMMLHASQRKFSLLLFWSLDRLTREGTLATLQYLERLTSYQVGYKSFTEPYLDSCGTFKDVVISLLATMAKQERIRMGERVRAGIAQARRVATTWASPTARVEIQGCGRTAEGAYTDKRTV